MDQTENESHGSSHYQFRWVVWLRELTGLVNDPVGKDTTGMRVDADDYKRTFGVPVESKEEANSARGAARPPDVPERLKKALEQAYAARTFEIEMYWKRATYFWAFIAAAFVGYATFLSGEHPRAFAALLMSQIGLTFSFAWQRANQGSKFWQENWENHVDLLEDGVTGPLYKTITRRPRALSEESKWIDRKTGPLQVSVSKINGIVSRYVVFIWLQLTVAAVLALWSDEIHFWLSAGSFRLHLVRSVTALVVIALNSLFVWQLHKHAATHSGPHEPVIWRRDKKVQMGNGGSAD